MPIELFYFNAKKIGDNTVQLTWESLNTHFDDQFEVQRSADGKTFEAIETVDTEQLYIQVFYEFFDDNPLLGKSYYRLKMNDADGVIKYSDIRSVEIKKYCTSFEQGQYIVRIEELGISKPLIKL